MGTEIIRETFGEQDYARFRERLERCLADLGELLARPGFGVGPVTIGAELEVCLVDGAGLPLPRNQAVRDLAADPRITLELNRYNLELNASPVPLAGTPVHRAGRRARLAAGPGRRRGPGAARPDRADRHPAHPPPGPPGPGHGDRHGPLPGTGSRPAAAAPGPVPYPDRRSRAAGADQRARHGRRGEHLVPGAPAGRPGRVHPGLQRGSAGDRAGAGRGRQLTHVPRPAALGGDQDRAVQAVGRGPRQRRPAARPGARGVRHGLAAGRRAGAVHRERPAARAAAPLRQRRVRRGAACRRWTSSACTRARSGAGTGPSTTPRQGATCGSRCAPCPPGRPSPTCWPTRPS